MLRPMDHILIIKCTIALINIYIYTHKNKTFVVVSNQKKYKSKPYLNDHLLYRKSILKIETNLHFLNYRMFTKQSLKIYTNCSNVRKLIHEF